jgi:glycosyltransferase involved in cell wall biosynthesis
LNTRGLDEIGSGLSDRLSSLREPTDRLLRIGFVISLFAPRESGAERQARLQAEALARRGHHVTVYTRTLENLPTVQNHMTLPGGGRVVVRRVIRTSTLGPTFGLSYVARLASVLVRERRSLDIVHTHQALWEAITTGLTRDRLRCPVLVQPASSGYDGEAQELMRTKGAGVLRRLAVRNRHFACISAEIADEWAALGVPRSAMIQSASGVDTAVYRPADMPPLSDRGRFQAVFTGRLHDQKQVDVLIRAWPIVRRIAPARLLVVGDGPLRDELTRLRDSLGLTEADVELTGRLDDPAAALRSSDLFVLPSRAEGMSNSLLEAMATGLPCVVSAIGGNVDLIQPELTGRLVSESSPEAWADAILGVYRNPEAARRWGSAARERVEREYSIDAIVDRNVLLYRRLIHEGR